MKKTIMFLGVLSLGLAQAQQYDGKVGINTETPSATLNVKSKTGTTASTKNFELQNASDKKLVTVLDDGKVGINNSSPRYLLDLTAIGKGYEDNSIAIRGYRDRGSIKMGLNFFRAVGTQASPVSVSKGDGIGVLGFFPYNGTKYINVAEISTVVTGDVSATEIPVSIDFMTKPDGSDRNVPALRIYHTRNIGMGIMEPTHKLHIKANADPLKLEGLQEATTGDIKNLVVVDGVVKVGSATSDANVKLGTGTSKPCNATNAGTINYEEITKDGKKTGVFGFCMKRNDNEYVWAYMVGGTNPFGTSANGANFADGIKD